MPPIPIILSFGKPLSFNAKYVIVSIGLLITMMIQSGEYCNKFFVTVFTIPAFMPINSSLVIPGLRGIPDVITATLLPAVFV